MTSVWHICGLLFTAVINFVWTKKIGKMKLGRTSTIVLQRGYPEIDIIVRCWPCVVMSCDDQHLCLLVTSLNQTVVCVQCGVLMKFVPLIFKTSAGQHFLHCVTFELKNTSFNGWLTNSSILITSVWHNVEFQ